MRAPRPDRGERRDAPRAAPRSRRAAPDQPSGHRIEDGKLEIPGNPIAEWAKKRPPTVEPLLAYVTSGKMRRSVIDALKCLGGPLVVTVEIDPKTERVATWSVRAKIVDGKADPKVGSGV